MKLNPQLKELTIYGCLQITSLLWENIANFTPNLEKLSFESSFGMLIAHISNFRKLKSLIVKSISEVLSIDLIDALIENNVPLEELGMLGKYPLTNALNVPRLKLLKKLCLLQMTEEKLIEYVKALPALKHMIALKSPGITVNGIIEALQHGKELSLLVVDTKQFVLDLNGYNSILNLAKGRQVYKYSSIYIY